MQVLSQKMWSGTADTIAFVQFQSKSKRLKEGPGINIAGYVNGDDSLVLHYNFDQKSIKDQSVYKRGNAVKGNLDMGKGLSGKSVVLSAHNSFIQLPLKEIGYNYTISFQIKPYQAPAGEKILFSTENATVKSADQDGKLGFSREGYDYQFDYKLPLDQWTLITITGNNNGTSLFVNGKLQERLLRKKVLFQDSKSKMFKMQTLVFPLQTLGGGENGFIGEIDELKIYNKVLTDKEIGGL